MISSLAWVRKGVSLALPVQTAPQETTTLTPEAALKLAKKKAALALQRAALEQSADSPDSGTPVNGSDEDMSEDDDDDDEGDHSSIDVDMQGGEGGDDEDIIKKYNLNDYTSDSSEDEADDDQDETENTPNIFSNIRGLVYHSNPLEDPYITLDPNPANPDSLEAQEWRELEILPSDNVLLTAKTVDDVSYLEAYVYEDGEDNLYVHHDIMLPTFPLCLEWLDWSCPDSNTQGREGGQARKRGNMVAIGSFDPHVEIWDLDLIDAVAPQIVLGPNDPTDLGLSAPSKKKKGGPARIAKRMNPDTHVDAVLGLSWNAACPQFMATASADTTVKLWDLNSPSKALRSFTHHKNKVQCVQWNPTDPSVLLTGAYDKRVCVFDTRTPDSTLSWKLSSDVECLQWSPWRTHEWFVATEAGLVQCFDGRMMGETALYTIHAHDLAVSAMDLSRTRPGCLVTGSADRTVKVWNVGGGSPSVVTSRDVGVGRVFSCSFCPDAVLESVDPNSSDSAGDGLVLAVAGAKDKVVLWNLAANAGVQRAFFKDGSSSSTGSTPTLSAPSASNRREVLTVDEEDAEEGDSDQDAMDVGARR